MAGMWKEFKQFAIKGNMIDLAVGVIIGAAFSKVVTSIVNDLVMPVVGQILGKVNFPELFISLNGKSYSTLEEAKADAAATLNYGLFINTMLDFLIVAFVIFIAVKQINKVRKRFEKSSEPAPDPKAGLKDCPECLSEIPEKATRCKYCTAVVQAVSE